MTPKKREKIRPFRAPLPTGKWGTEQWGRVNWPEGWEAVERPGAWVLQSCRAVRKKTRMANGDRYEPQAAWTGRYQRLCGCGRTFMSAPVALSAVAVYVRRLADPQKLVPAVMPGPLALARCPYCRTYRRSPAGRAKAATIARAKAAARQRKHRLKEQHGTTD